MDKIRSRKTILDRIEKPQIPDREYPVQMFGVIPDRMDIQTSLLQKAIDKVSEMGGGRVAVPAGRYRTGALRLKDKVDLHLASEDTVLSFVNEDIHLHYPVVFSHWEATPCYNFSALLYACGAQDIALTGKGTLDGGADAEHWWDWHHQVEDAWSADKRDLQLADRNALRQMNLDGVPVDERVFGPGHFLRPDLIQIIRCKRVLLQGVTLKNSPMWQLNPVLCESVTVDGMTFLSHGPNNDGCDPESCSGVQIAGCRFDTGDDCISLKSGRDRDGREAAAPCQYVLIEENEFADGHGGVALGSEMSGGIHHVLAWRNHFSSPHLTYALRLKTNAKRGGRVEDIILADSVMEHVHGAAVHGTMLYEDGRDGSDLPVFQNIRIENITAHGGEYGIFLEAFEEVPITGLALKNIRIDGAAQAMRSMNWKDPVVEDVTINGQSYPRPGKVRILGVPVEGGQVTASAQICGGDGRCRFLWEISADGKTWESIKEGMAEGSPGRTERGAAKTACITIFAGCGFVRVTACDRMGNKETSREYIVLSRELAKERSRDRQRLICRGMLDEDDVTPDEQPVTRGQLARMLLPLAAAYGRYAHKEKDKENALCCIDSCTDCLRTAVSCGLLARANDGRDLPEGTIFRQEMATVAMQACGVDYRNASSTMPACKDAKKVSNNYGTNVARALYFGFMDLDQAGCFAPKQLVTMGEAVKILDRVADFAGI